MKTIPILRDDVLKSVYFIVCLTQNQSGSSMHGSLSSKGDLIGGIFDRWINTFPEAIIFNKEILLDISNGHDVKIISDFYSYDPTLAGIAPDVIGIKVDGRVVPFAQFDNHWVPVKGAPQIEIKTFKKPQKMVSLRNQGYDGKYLVMVESDFKIDYLVPFFDKRIFDRSVYDELRMDDNHFVISNILGTLNTFPEVNCSSDEIGTVSLLRITTSDDFMSNSTHCEGRVSVRRISKIEEVTSGRVRTDMDTPLKTFVDKLPIGLYRFNSNWYDGLVDGIPCFANSSGALHKVRCLDIQVSNIEKIRVVKKTQSAFYVMADDVASLNGVPLEKGKLYKASCDTLDRESNDGEEFFFQKELLRYIPSKEMQLKKEISKFIK